MNMKEIVGNFVKKYKLMLIIGVAIIAVLSITDITISIIDKAKRSDDIILQEYTDLDYDHVYEKITFADFDNLIKEKASFVIYFGRPDCHSCKIVVPSVNEYAKSVNLDKIYYINTSEYHERIKEISDNKTYDFIGTPAFVFFRNGEYLYSNQSDAYRSNNSIYDSVVLAINDFLNLSENKD